MSKLKLLTLGVLAMMSIAANAEERDVPINCHKDNLPNKQTSVNRTAHHLVVHATYDNETNILYIRGNVSTHVNIHVFCTTKSFDASSSVLNTSFLLPSTGIYIIRIQGIEWYAEGILEI